MLRGEVAARFCLVETQDKAFLLVFYNVVVSAFKFGGNMYMLLLARVSTGQIYYLKSLLTQLQSHLAEFSAVAKNFDSNPNLTNHCRLIATCSKRNSRVTQILPLLQTYRHMQ